MMGQNRKFITNLKIYRCRTNQNWSQDHRQRIKQSPNILANTVTTSSIGHQHSLLVVLASISLPVHLLLCALRHHGMGMRMGRVPEGGAGGC